MREHQTEHHLRTDLRPDMGVSSPMGQEDHQPRELWLNRLEDALILRKQADLRQLSPEQQFGLISSRVKSLVTERELREKLCVSHESDKPLVVKFGIDPTSADVHLGHAVPLMIASRFQRMGHHLVFVIGDSTAKIGDPTGRTASRPILTAEQIAQNYQRYAEQVKPIIDLSRCQVLLNSEWLAKFSTTDFVQLLQGINVGNLMQRDDFRNRIAGGGGFSVAELVYPVMMGVDSLILKPDVEIGGEDQLLNLHMCRQIMGNNRLPPETIITTELLLGTQGDGRKMSKSQGNYIGLDESPDAMYQKLMRIPDGRMVEAYFKSLTEINDLEWNEIQKAMQEEDIASARVRQLLSRVVVGTIYGHDATENAQAIFQHGPIYRQVTLGNFAHPQTLLGLLLAVGAATSNAHARRLITQGAVSINDTRITEVSTLVTFSAGVELRLKVGKRLFLNVCQS